MPKVKPDILLITQSLQRIVDAKYAGNASQLGRELGEVDSTFSRILNGFSEKGAFRVVRKLVDSGYDESLLLSGGWKHSQIKPQENPSDNTGKSTYISGSQSHTTLQGQESVTSNTLSDNPNQEVGMEVPRDGGLSSTVHIPEYIEVVMFDQVVARVKMSLIVPGQVHRMDVTPNFVKPGSPQTTNEKPPVHKD